MLPWSFICCMLYALASASSLDSDYSYELDEPGTNHSTSRTAIKPEPRVDVTVQHKLHSSSTKKPINSSKSKANNTSSPKRASIERVLHPSLYAVWDDYNHICLLAKFQASFTIRYDTISGPAQLIDKMPANARSKGRCDQIDEEPVIDIMWKDRQLNVGSQQRNSTGGFTFRIIYQKYINENRWGIQQMQLLYHTGHPVFRGSIDPRKFIVKSNRDDHRLQFRTNFEHSMLCPSPPPIQMYDGEGNMRVTARLSNMQIQAFDFGTIRGPVNFDPFMRCSQVSYGSGVAHPLTTMRDDSITFGVSVMTISIAALTVVGYAIYRSHFVESEKYKNII